MKKVLSLLKYEVFDFILLFLIISAIYYKFFLFGKIPFPGDLLVGSYSPWFDYFKIPVQNPLISDVFSQLFLWKYLSIDIFKSGQWPLWNPFSFTGNPLLATYQSATLYPLNILLLLPKYLGWGFFIFSQTLLAAVNMYLLLSLYASSKLARFTGAVIFALGGLMTTWIEQGIPVHGIIWLPLSLYFVDKFLLQNKFRYLLLLVGSLSLSILAGHFQMMVYSLLVVFVYALFRALRKNIRNFLLCFLPISFSMLFAVLISSVQLLPSFDLFKKSVRLTENYTGEFGFGLLTLADFLKFFTADFFGNPVTRNYWGYLNYFETSGFVGTLSLPLLIFSFLFLKKNKLSIFFLSLFVLSLIFTFQNPLSLSIYQLKLPFLTASFASRMLFVTVFSIGVLAALSLNQILSSNEDKRFLKTLLYSLATLIGVLVGILLSRIYLMYTLKTQSDVFLKTIDISLRNDLLPVFLTLSLYSATLLIRRTNLSKRIQLLFCCTLLLILLTLDLSRYFLKFNPFVAQDLIFPTVPTLQFLKNQPGLFRVGREHGETLPPNTWIAYNLQSPEGYDPIYLNQYGKFIRFLNGGDFRSGSTSRYAEITSRYNSPYLDTANVVYFIALLRDASGNIPGDLLDDKFKDTDYKLVFKDKSAAILENPHSLGRVYFAKNIFTASPSEIENLFMKDETFDPRETTALSRNLKITSVTGKGGAKIMEYSPNIVKINTDTSSEEILVLADQYEEGWEVTVDGKESGISPANLIFRAVKVPKGNHEVVFSYYPKSFDIGLKISIGMMLLICFGLIVSIKTKRF